MVAPLAPLPPPLLLLLFPAAHLGCCAREEGADTADATADGTRG
jgi:hypothetical protein